MGDKDYSEGGPNLLSPGVPGVSAHISRRIEPIKGTKINKKYQPLLSISWSLRTIIDILGIK